MQAQENRDKKKMKARQRKVHLSTSDYCITGCKDAIQEFSEEIGDVWIIDVEVD